MNNDFARSLIRTVPNFPIEGIRFRDIQPLIAHGAAFHHVVEQMSAPFVGTGVTKIVSLEARGFYFGGALSMTLGIGGVMMRKVGPNGETKLPLAEDPHSYGTEYSKDRMAMQQDAILPHDLVIVADDVIAKGGTMKAALESIHKKGANVAGFVALIECSDLGGRARIEEGGHKLHTIFRFTETE
jgi:adenine phosphoribosyltransferase